MTIQDIYVIVAQRNLDILMKSAHPVFLLWVMAFRVGFR